MAEPNNDNREELLRLREENLRLREERLEGHSTTAKRPRDKPTIVNVKQVNEGCASGCGGLLAVSIALVFILRSCGG